MLGIGLLFAMLTTTPPAQPNMPPTIAYEVRVQSRKFGIDPTLVMGLIRTESNFDTRAAGNGGIGLGQLSPTTARWIFGKLGLKYSRERLFQPKYNITATAWYLRYLLDKYRWNTHTALTAYNRGEGGMRSYAFRSGTTRSRYSEKVLKFRHIYKEKGSH